MVSFFGECVLSLDWRDGGRKVWVERADPKVRISRELVAMALGADPRSPVEPGALLVIDGVNQKVIYRIGAYHNEGYYDAEWPD
jgi:hypothetical protein